VGTESYQCYPEIYHSPPRSKKELAPILGDFIREVIGDLLSYTGKDFFVEDNTWNVFFAKELLELIPEAKIIHVYRDPRDVVASFSHQRWSPTDRVQGAKWYKVMMTHWFNVRSTLSDDSYYEISLEALVASPEKVLRDVCEFAEISFDRTMLEVDLSHSHSGRWKREYSEREKAEIDRILEDVIVDLGYELANC
jgi:hypothetical protein